MIRRILCAVLLCLFCCPHSRAAVIDNYAPTTNDRFANATNFVGQGFDWSGVGMSTAGRWATLIGPNTVISANHFQPRGNVTFFPGNDSTATAVELPVVTGQRLGETDIWLGCLGAVAPPAIHSYDFATDLLSSSSFAASSVNGAQAFMVGRSPSLFPTVLDQTIGRNTIDEYVENAGGGLGADVDTLQLIYDAATGAGDVDNSAYEPFETYLEAGDSGAPLFVESNDQLLLLGIASFVTTGNVTASHVSYAGNESDEVNDTINFCLSVVPEPSSASLCVIALVLLGGRRRSAS